MFYVKNITTVMIFIQIAFNFLNAIRVFTQSRLGCRTDKTPFVRFRFQTFPLLLIGPLSK